MNRLTTALLVLLLGLTALPAAAQPVPSPVWRANIADHLALSLRSPRPGVRAATMQLILDLDRQRPDLDLSAAVDPLLDIYGGDRDASFRLMALSALRALENPYGMERLADLVQHERSPTVRRVTLKTLADYRNGL
ncbi:MAG: hypothetical protein D6746_11540 [Bacteroidetes bacterium]|nr:MAG: hypothetical protein D6746_11540 [Bacteroidota bacterium]GIV58517.1 MAG: hypothetical protein KatS3mg042_1430 [Rhodothermaceae bacterium]